jgi:hypothetical protein
MSTSTESKEASMHLKSIMLAVTGGIVIAAGCFAAGLYAGGAPLRRSVALSGGPSGRIATQLSHIANRFGSRHGSYSKDRVVEVQVQLAEEQSLLAAQFYCQMTPMYRDLAQRAAHRLSVSPFVQNATDEKGREAREYLAQTAPNAAACVRFRPTVAMQRSSALAEQTGLAAN